MWTARTRDGTAQLLILTEFQGRQDRLMPLRTTIYALMAVQELLRRTRPPPHPDTIEVLQPTVLLDAEGPWGPGQLHEGHAGGAAQAGAGRGGRQWHR